MKRREKILKPTPNSADEVSLDRAYLQINRICFGLAPIGSMPDTYGYGVTVDDAHATVRAIFDSGVGFFRYVKELRSWAQ